MEESYGNDIPSFQRFLDNFVKSISENSKESDKLPFRLFNLHFVYEELQGECLELCLRYLKLQHCPDLLLAAISKAVYEQIKNIDQLEFEDDEVEEKDENVEEKKEEKDINSDKVIDSKKEKVLSSAILCTHVIDLVDDICKKWQRKLPDILVPKKLLQSSFSEIKNTRRKMEDRNVMIPDLRSLFDLKDHPDQSYYAVFDGHAGSEAATYSSTHLHLHMINSPDFQSDPTSSLKHAYKTTDEKFIAKAQRENLRSGSTGISALIRGDKLYVSWLGDSQAVLIKDGKCISIMQPHKPEREDEQKRIQAQGGIVGNMDGVWRVNATLSVARAIGDAAQKCFICSDADVTTIDLDGKEDYIVLACDGLWDVVTEDSIADIVYDHLLETNGDKSSVAKTLVTKARDSGSSDNITVIVVFLRDEIAVPQGKQLFDFSQGDSQGNEHQDENKDNSGEDNSKNTDSDQSKADPSGSDNSNTSDKKSDGQTNDVKESEYLDPLHNLSDIHHEQNILTVNKSKKNSQSLSETSDHSGETPEISAVRKVNQSIAEKNLSLIDSSSPEEDLPVLKKENLFIFESVHDNHEYTDHPASRGGRSSSLPSCLQMSDNFQTEIHDGVVLTKSHGVSRETDANLNLKGQSLTPENMANMENRNFMASNVKKYSRSKFLIERYRNMDYLTPDGLPDKELLEPIRFKKTGKRKGKKTKRAGKGQVQKEPENSPRKYFKKPPENVPVIWAFAATNKASVKNHKLNHVAKNGRVALATVGSNEMLDSSSPQNADGLEKIVKSNKHTFITHYDQRDIENLVVPHPVFDPSPTAMLNNSLPLQSSSTSSLPPVIHPTLAIYGSKSPANTQPEKFHMSWKPKRIHRVTNSIVQDVPPTPLTNLKISRNNDEDDHNQ